MKLQHYFGFTKRQYRGLILLLLLNFGVIAFYISENYFYKVKPPYDFSKLIAKLDSSENANIKPIEDSLYFFDPNHLSAEDLINLGLEEQLAVRIKKYLSKGGRFYDSQDLLKIYGMDRIWFAKVEPFIKIKLQQNAVPEKRRVLKPFPFDPNAVTLSDVLKMGINERAAHSWVKYLANGGRYKTCDDLKKTYHLSDGEFNSLLPFCEIKKKENLPFQIVDVNTADSILLLKIKGVGPAYSHRVLQYRNILGGFVHLDQLLEIYGIDSAKYEELKPQIKISAFDVKTLAVNYNDFKVLLKHPYLNYEQVKSIVNYRNNLGALNSLSELMELEGFEADDTLRLKPYLTF